MNERVDAVRTTDALDRQSGPKPRDGLLAGKVVLIFGASRGIGAAAAELFAREGATVTLSSRSGDQLDEVVARIQEMGAHADRVLADVDETASIRAAVEHVVARHGRLDAAFNNAGQSVRHVPLTHLGEDEFETAMNVNLRSVFLAMRYEVEAIRATSGRGAIVNTSSVASFTGRPRLGVYAAAKRAVNSLTETAARELGPAGIRVNAIAPGTTRTAMIEKWAEEEPGLLNRLRASTPLGRAAEPSEIAEAAAWLLSDRASFVTGAVLPVDGGMRA